ncbi:hypothetical protein M0802_016212 [Mischocyttarus mexicanus]|nr:hypothetical protein M0802_016212 [Mischocyttarus mexicanus]
MTKQLASVNVPKILAIVNLLQLLASGNVPMLVSSRNMPKLLSSGYMLKLLVSVNVPKLFQRFCAQAISQRGYVPKLLSSVNVTKQLASVNVPKILAIVNLLQLLASGNVLMLPMAKNLDHGTFLPNKLINNGNRYKIQTGDITEKDEPSKETKQYPNLANTERRKIKIENRVLRMDSEMDTDSEDVQEWIPAKSTKLKDFKKRKISEVNNYNNISSAPTLTKWLQEIPISNLFKLLEDSTETQNNTEKQEETKSVKPPPIYIEAEVIDPLLELLDETAGRNNYIIKQLKDNQVKPLPLFFIELAPQDNNKNIYEINNLLNTIIKIEPPKTKRVIPQCTQCQAYGHTKNYCNRNPACVKCAQKHLTTHCPQVGRIEKVICVNCNGNHPANYKGCQTRKLLQQKLFPTLRKKVLENPILDEAYKDNHYNKQNVNANTDYIPVFEHNKPIRSYADVT